MRKEDISSLFPLPTSISTTNRHSKKTYDVRVTLNKSGRNRQCVRFGLLNYAAAMAQEHLFVEVSDIEFCKDRLYFRFHDEKEHRNIHTLSKSAKENKGVGFYFSITPSEKAEKLYRMNWIGKTFAFKHDPEIDLFYIENVKEG